MINIPGQDKKWVQTNDSSVLGNIWASYNLDLTDNKGRVRVGDRMLLNVSSSDLANLGVPVAFRAFNVAGVRIYTVAGSRVFKTNAASPPDFPSTTFVQDALSGTPTTCSSAHSDMEVFNGYLYVTTTSKTVYRLDNTGTWSTLDTLTGSSGSAHLLCSYGGRLYMTTGVGSSILSWNAASTETVTPTVGTSQYSLILNNNDTPTSYITFLRASSNRIWIGTINQSGGKGYVYEWDGSANQVTKSYRLDSQGALACVIKDDIPYIMDTNGVLQVWNGGTFKPLASLNRKNNYQLYNATGGTNDRFIHPNGMSVIEGNINVLINTNNFNSGATTEETIPAGIWEYTEDTGLYHKHSLGLGKTDANPFTDFGQFKVAAVGALSEANIPNNSSSRNGTFLTGAQYYTDATTTAYGIFYDDSVRAKQKSGYLITTKIDSSNITDAWNKFYARHRKLISATDKIVAKYRSAETDAAEIIITWASTTSFTTTDASFANYAVGDEVQVIQGIGSGKPSHITSIVNNAGTYTVGVDETYAGATGTAKAWINKWKKLNPVIQNTVRSYESMGIPDNQAATSAQFKIWMLFTHPDELENLDVVSAVNQTGK